MGRFLNSYFSMGSYGPPQLTNKGAQAFSTALTAINPIFRDQNRIKNTWIGGGSIGTTGASNLFNTGGQIASSLNNPVGLGIQGGLQMAGAMTDLYSYNPEVDDLDNSYSSNQLASFDLSQEAGSVNNFMDEFRSSAAKKIGSSTLGGASLGTAIMPGIGTAIGAATGLLGSFIGKEFAKRKAEEANNKMKEEYSQGIGRFNRASESFYDKQNALEKYLAKKQSMFNVPNNTPYFYI